MRIQYWLSPAQRDVMIAHLDGIAVPIVHASQCRDGWKAREVAARTATTISLIARGFIKTDNKITPTHTTITDEGRTALAGALAEWANSIVAAMRSSNTIKNQMDAILVDGAIREEPAT